MASILPQSCAAPKPRSGGIPVATGFSRWLEEMPPLRGLRGALSWDHPGIQGFAGLRQGLRVSPNRFPGIAVIFDATNDVFEVVALGVKTGIRYFAPLQR